jgi:acetyl esterase/lipase
VRRLAPQWGLVDPRVAILGFSAGGHLASTAAVHADRFTCPQDDLAKLHSARPDAAVLCYPVIDLIGEFIHKGSRMNLLAEPFDPALAELLSSHLQVTADTPPTFLWHTADDGAVPVVNSLFFALQCRRYGVPVELHVYEKGTHGLGLAMDHPDGIGAWSELAARFLHRRL